MNKEQQIVKFVINETNAQILIKIHFSLVCPTVWKCMQNLQLSDGTKHLINTQLNMTALFALIANTFARTL